MVIIPQYVHRIIVKTPKIHVTCQLCQFFKVYICTYKGMGEMVMDIQLNINSN